MKNNLLKKQMVAVCLIAMTLLIAGCGQATNATKPTEIVATEATTAQETTIIATTTQNTTAAPTTTEPQITTAYLSDSITGYDIVTETYTEGTVEVLYPQLAGMADTAFMKTVNALIEENALAPYIEAVAALEEGQTYEAEAYFDIKYQSKDLLSIAFGSYNNFTPSVHPYQLFYSLNIDMNTGNALSLADLVPNIDESFAEAVANGTYAGEYEEDVVPQLREGTFGQPADLENLLFQLKDDSAVTGIYAYVTEDALGISLPVGHAMGDHIEFEVTFSQLKALGFKGWQSIFDK